VSDVLSRRNVVLLGGYSRRYFLSWTAGWSFALTIYLARIVTPLVGFALWTRAMPGDASVAAYFVALIFVHLATDSPEEHTFAQGVYDGTFTDVLLRPHPMPLGTIGFNIAFKAFNVLGAIPIAVAVAVLADVRFEVSRVLLAVPAVVLGSSIAFVLKFTLAQSSFWTPRVFAVTQLGNMLVFTLGGGAAPIPLLPDSVRGWLEVMPFRAIVGFPSEVASGLVSGRDVVVGYALQVAWFAVLSLASRTVWRAGVRRYVAIGG
jgi:ABC-2 type transport system permease protein